MERFRSFIKGAFSYPRLLLTTHPITAVSVISASVLYAIYSFIEISLHYNTRDRYEIPLDIFCHICLAILFFAVFALCLESIRPGWSITVKACVFGFFALLSVLMSFIVSDYIEKGHARYKNLLLALRDSLGFGTVALYIGGLMVLSLLLALYFSYSHDIHQRFNDHVMNAHAKMFFTSIIYGVIQLGVLFLTLIVTLLLYDDAFEYIIPVLILINGLFFAPAIICAAIRENEKANMFMQVLVRYVMLTIVLLAYGIIYIYILKLIITKSVPSNSVYAILTALFIVSMIITYMCTVFECKGFLQKFAFNAPLIFAPFILMQCYTVFVRIGQYGLTPKRYFGIAFILFETVYIVYYTISLKREKEVAGRNLLLIMCFFIVIAIFMPGISGRSLSTTLAKKTLRSYLEKTYAGASVTDEDCVRANAAYGFLNDKDFGEARIEKYFASLDEDTIETLKEKARIASKNLSETARKENIEAEMHYPKDGYYSSEFVTLFDNDRIDISDYKTLMFVEISAPEKYDGKDPQPISTSALDVRPYDRDYEIKASAPTVMTVDLSGYCNKFNSYMSDRDDGILYYDECDKKIAAMSIININENARLYITHADISRNLSNETVRVDIQGYLFTD